MPLWNTYLNELRKKSAFNKRLFGTNTHITLSYANCRYFKYFYLRYNFQQRILPRAMGPWEIVVHLKVLYFTLKPKAIQFNSDTILVIFR